MSRRLGLLLRLAARARLVSLLATVGVSSVAVWVAADVFLVTNRNDDGPGSLRDAIVQANALPGADEIVFDPALSGQTITLTSGQLSITDDLVISGLGHDQLAVARDAGAPAFRIFEIDDGDDENVIEVVISGLTIENGSVVSNDISTPARGGGVLSQEDLALREVAVTWNSAASATSHHGGTSRATGGGVYSGHHLVLTNSTIANNEAWADEFANYTSCYAAGGGVLAEGYLGLQRSVVVQNEARVHSNYFATVHGGGIRAADSVVRNSTISGNTAHSDGYSGAGGEGGGIHADNLVVENSTVSGNLALGGTGGNYCSYARGGGIQTGSLSMTNSTVSDNRAEDDGTLPCISASGGGARVTGTPAVILNSTISGNSLDARWTYGGHLYAYEWGGGADLPTGATVESTISFGNTGYFGPDIFSSGLAVPAYNLVGDPSGSTIPIGVDGNITGDPQLGPLAANGGPTYTQAIAFDSIAADSGANPDGLRTDQRGYWPRDFGGLTDIGAYECGAGETLLADDFESSMTGAWSWVADVHSVSLSGGVSLQVARVPAGTFWMGALGIERGAASDEYPRHQVTLTRDVYLGTFEVKQAQWQAIMGANPAHDYGVGDEYPVYYVSWEDIAGPGGFIERLNQYLTSTGQPGAGLYRLPTEAEWEYAARARTTTRFSFGDVLECSDDCQPCSIMGGYMWWCSNTTTTRPVGLKCQNPFGLWDMHGNVAEWTADWYGGYPAGARVDPTGPALGMFHAARGGSFSEAAVDARSAARRAYPPGYSSESLGFRVARDPE